MERLLARRVLAAGLLLGLLTEIVLDGPAFGLNIPLVLIALLAAAWLLRRHDRAPDPLDAWLPIVAVVLAGFVAIRADPFLALLDTLVALAFTGASVVAFSGLAVTRRSASVVAAMGLWTLGALGWGPTRTIAAARPIPPSSAPSAPSAPSHPSAPAETGWAPAETGWVPPSPSRLPSWSGPVARGLMVGIPLALIFAVLFASADPIFRRGLDDVLGLRIDLGAFPGRVLFVLAAAWFAVSLLAVAATGLPGVERGASLEAAAGSPPIDRLRFLGAVEAIVILLVIDLVVAAFVGLQVAYLFGGVDTLAAIGMTYSDYARRGFFELVAAACLAGAVVVALETTVERRSHPYIAALLVLVGLSGAVLVSAAMRLRLYQDAYGWTELRLYVLVAIGSLGLALAATALLVLTNRTRWLGQVLAVIGVVALVGLNVIAPSAVVAERNIARVLDPTLVPADGHAGLDRAYLAVLPDDAIPVVVAALPLLPAADRGAITWFLDQRASELSSDPAYQGPAAWNLGRERARMALETLR